MKHTAYELHVQLRYIEPPIWRTLEVPGSAALEDVQYAIQYAMGWGNSHLHQFKIGKRQYGMVDVDDTGDLDLEDESIHALQIDNRCAPQADQESGNRQPADSPGAALRVGLRPTSAGEGGSNHPLAPRCGRATSGGKPPQSQGRLHDVAKADPRLFESVPNPGQPPLASTA